jgi:hypothetical protein
MSICTANLSKILYIDKMIKVLKIDLGKTPHELIFTIGGSRIYSSVNGRFVER